MILIKFLLQIQVQIMLPFPFLISTGKHPNPMFLLESQKVPISAQLITFIHHTIYIFCILLKIFFDIDCGHKFVTQS